MKIRPAKFSDVKDIFDLIRGKAEFDDCLDSLQATEQNINEAFFSENPKAWAIVAEVNSKLVGIATYYYIYSTFKAKPGIWLDDLFIFAEFRKMGIGKALINQLCITAKKMGCCRIDWIVARDNEIGKGFYRSLGANIFEEVRHARLEEDVIYNAFNENV